MICDDWAMTKKRFDAWWANSCIDRPMLRVVARRETPLGSPEPVAPPATDEALHLDADRLIREAKNRLLTHRYMAEAYPNLDLNIGPGSLAVYLGSEPVFRPDTFWFTECLGSAEAFEAIFDPKNPWFVRHLDLLSQAQAASDGQYLVNIPDIIENIDIYAAMRGPQNTCYDLIDEPDAVQRAIQQIDDAYFPCYDRFRDALISEDGVTGYTAFNVLGTGRVAKIQCDFSALMSPDQFRKFVLPSLRKQCKILDHSVYHLDGPDAIKHLDALMEIDELQALQWTCGAGQPDSASPRWYPIYDRVKAAGKALHLTIFEGDFDHWIRSCDTLVERYGVDGMYFQLPVMAEAEANEFIEYADRHWRRTHA